MKTKIIYVSKSKLYPSFGYAYEKPPRIKIRKDLPKSVQNFVLEHEKYHLKDWQRLKKQKKEYNWILGEIKAGVYGASKHPFGALLAFLMSLQSYRIKLYFQRFRKGK